MVPLLFLFCSRSHFCSSIFNGLFLSFQLSGIIIFYCLVRFQSIFGGISILAWQWIEAACFLKLHAFLNLVRWYLCFSFLPGSCIATFTLQFLVQRVFHSVLRLLFDTGFYAFSWRLFSLLSAWPTFWILGFFSFCRFVYAASAQFYNRHNGR